MLNLNDRFLLCQVNVRFRLRKNINANTSFGSKQLRILNGGAVAGGSLVMAVCTTSQIQEDPLTDLGIELKCWPKDISCDSRESRILE